jgi:DNA-directed RNA polymerase specialized sigma24 family protein
MCGHPRDQTIMNIHAVRLALAGFDDQVVAYQRLGSTSEADDAVQEAWLRLSRTDPGTSGLLPAPRA